MDDGLQVRQADLDNADDGAAVVALLDAYARDPMGDGKPLADAVREQLIPGLREHPAAIVWLAFHNERPVGVATSFVGFSTFQAARLINIHDLAVLPDERSKGVGRAILAAIEAHAREQGCCRLTLEALERNLPARGLYESIGFRQPTHGDGAAGGAIFMLKPLA